MPHKSPCELAAECLAMAFRADNQSDRIRLIEMAMRWYELAIIAAMGSLGREGGSAGSANAPQSGLMGGVSPQ